MMAKVKWTREMAEAAGLPWIDPKATRKGQGVHKSKRVSLMRVHDRKTLVAAESPLHYNAGKASMSRTEAYHELREFLDKYSGDGVSPEQLSVSSGIPVHHILDLIKERLIVDRRILLGRNHKGGSNVARTIRVD